jgi:hypothetical protein
MIPYPIDLGMQSQQFECESELRLQDFDHLSRRAGTGEVSSLHLVENLHFWEHAIRKDGSPVIPCGVELWICVEDFSRELERLV